VSGSVGLRRVRCGARVRFSRRAFSPAHSGVLSFMTGLSTVNSPRPIGLPMRVLGTALLFVLDFSFIFVALGASASVLGTLSSALPPRFLKESAGVFVIAFGVFIDGESVRIPWLYGEKAHRPVICARLRMLRPSSMGMPSLSGGRHASVRSRDDSRAWPARREAWPEAGTACRVLGGPRAPVRGCSLALGRATPCSDGSIVTRSSWNRIAGGVLVVVRHPDCIR